MTIHCKVIEDLLPLYVDQLTSEQSNQLIEDHLETCSQCMQMRLDLANELVPDSRARTEEVNISENHGQTLVKRIRKRMLLFISTAFLTALLVGMFSDIYIFSFLAYVLLGSSVLVLIFNVVGNSKKYWLSGTCMYLFSTLAGFSIGLYTVSIAIVLFTLAVGHSFARINKTWHSYAAIGIGLLIWLAAINIHTGFWLFYPGIMLIEQLF